MSNGDLEHQRRQNSDENEEGSDIEEVLTDLSDDEGEEEENSDSDSSESTGRPRPRPTFTSNETEWSTDLVDTHPEDFVEATGGLHDLPATANPIDFFSLFVPESFFSHMTHETNLYAEQCQQQKRQRDPYWKPVNEDDLRKYIYINIMFGLIQLPEMRMYWSEDPMFRIAAVADALGRQRFQKIHQYLHLNDNTQQPDRDSPHHDPLFKVRPLLDTVRSTCNNIYRPSRDLSIDEAMIGFNGRLHFKQYIPSKPSPYGIKVWCLAESKSGYMLNFSFYTGKNNNSDLPHGLGHHVVTNISQQFLHKNHCFYFDNFFSSIKLAEDLLNMKTYSCSTTRPNRKGWPFKEKTTRRAAGSIKMLQKGPIVATQWIDKRQVNIISTCVNPRVSTATRRTKDGPVDINIPLPVLTYNLNMGGVDLADQHRSYYSMGRPGMKWWRYAMWFIFQVAIVNSWLLLKKMNPQAQRDTPASSHLAFRKSLVESLLKGPSLRKRSCPATTSVAARAEPASAKHNLLRMAGRKKRCYQCSKDGIKAPSGRPAETVYGCPFCKVHLHKGHCYAKHHEELLL